MDINDVLNDLSELCDEDVTSVPPESREAVTKGHAAFQRYPASANVANSGTRRAMDDFVLNCRGSSKPPWGSPGLLARHKVGCGLTPEESRLDFGDKQMSENSEVQSVRSSLSDSNISLNYFSELDQCEDDWTGGSEDQPKAILRKKLIQKRSDTSAFLENQLTYQAIPKLLFTPGENLAGKAVQFIRVANENYVLNKTESTIEEDAEAILRDLKGKIQEVKKENEGVVKLMNDVSGGVLGFKKSVSQYTKEKRPSIQHLTEQLRSTAQNIDKLGDMNVDFEAKNECGHYEMHREPLVTYAGEDGDIPQTASDLDLVALQSEFDDAYRMGEHMLNNHRNNYSQNSINIPSHVMSASDYSRLLHAPGNLKPSPRPNLGIPRYKLAPYSSTSLCAEHDRHGMQGHKSSFNGVIRPGSATERYSVPRVTSHLYNEALNKTKDDFFIDDTNRRSGVQRKLYSGRTNLHRHVLEPRINSYNCQEEQYVSKEDYDEQIYESPRFGEVLEQEFETFKCEIKQHKSELHQIEDELKSLFMDNKSEDEEDFIANQEPREGIECDNGIDTAAMTQDIASGGVNPNTFPDQDRVCAAIQAARFQNARAVYSANDKTSRMSAVQKSVPMPVDLNNLSDADNDREKDVASPQQISYKNINNSCANEVNDLRSSGETLQREPQEGKNGKHTGPRKAHCSLSRTAERKVSKARLTWEVVKTEMKH